MSIQDIQNEIIDEFSMFEDWEERYQYMIDLSKVWVHADLINEKIVFTADSDAIITKGIIAILIRVFSNQRPKDIIEANTDFIDDIGLKEHLSPTRANGLVSMIKQLKMYAIAYQTQLQ